MLSSFEATDHSYRLGTWALPGRTPDPCADFLALRKRYSVNISHCEDTDCKEREPTVMSRASTMIRKLLFGLRSLTNLQIHPPLQVNSVTLGSKSQCVFQTIVPAALEHVRE